LFAEKVLIGHCEERFLRRGNLEALNNLNYEFASLRSQRQQKYFFSGLLKLEERKEPDIGVFGFTAEAGSASKRKALFPVHRKRAVVMVGRTH